MSASDRDIARSESIAAGTEVTKTPDRYTTQMYITVDEDLRLQYKDAYIILLADHPDAVSDTFPCVLGEERIRALHAVFGDWLEMRHTRDA
jgi:hypothetical protein